MRRRVWSGWDVPGAMSTQLHAVRVMVDSLGITEVCGEGGVTISRSGPQGGGVWYHEHTVFRSRSHGITVTVTWYHSHGHWGAGGAWSEVTVTVKESQRRGGITVWWGHDVGSRSWGLSRLYYHSHKVTGEGWGGGGVGAPLPKRGGSPPYRYVVHGHGATGPQAAGVWYMVTGPQGVGVWYHGQRSHGPQPLFSALVLPHWLNSMMRDAEGSQASQPASQGSVSPLLQCMLVVF